MNFIILLIVFCNHLIFVSIDISIPALQRICLQRSHNLKRKWHSFKHQYSSNPTFPHELISNFGLKSESGYSLVKYWTYFLLLSIPVFSSADASTMVNKPSPFASS